MLTPNVSDVLPELLIYTDIYSNSRRCRQTNLVNFVIIFGIIFSADATICACGQSSGLIRPTQPLSILLAIHQRKKFTRQKVILNYTQVTQNTKLKCLQFPKINYRPVLALTIISPLVYFWLHHPMF